MIDLRKELMNFTPINLESIEKNNPGISEEVKKSVLLYNNALDNLKMDSEDIAVIELKKAISLNPEFYEAINLLGLCYCYLNEYDKAEEMFKRVLKAENNGIKAYNYLKKMGSAEVEDLYKDSGDEKEAKAGNKKNQGKKAKASAEKQRRPDSNTGMKAFPVTGSVKNTRQQNLTKFMIGFIAGIIVTFLVCSPAILGKDKNGRNNGIADEDTGQNLTVAEENQYEEKYNQLSIDYENLKKELDAVTKDRDYYKEAIKLYDAENLYEARKYEDAADLLVQVKNVEFVGKEKEKYEELYNNVMPRAADAVYSQAYSLFQSNKYNEALSKYSKNPEYYEEYRNMDIVLYYIGKCYLELGDNENAKAMFLKTIEKFPNSEYAQYSRSRLNSISAGSGTID